MVSDSTEKRGSGLGLAIAKILVEAHGGAIGVRENMSAKTGSVLLVETSGAGAGFLPIHRDSRTPDQTISGDHEEAPFMMAAPDSRPARVSGLLSRLFISQDNVPVLA
jgi:signal transduction histidine kinase